jgi:hypothetical protein
VWVQAKDQASIGPSGVELAQRPAVLPHVSVLHAVGEGAWVGTPRGCRPPTIGAGIIALPFALREAGFIMGVLLLLAIGAMTVHMSAMLV